MNGVFQALEDELIKRGYKAKLVTDEERDPDCPTEAYLHVWDKINGTTLIDMIQWLSQHDYCIQQIVRAGAIDILVFHLGKHPLAESGSYYGLDSLETLFI